MEKEIKIGYDSQTELYILKNTFSNLCINGVEVKDVVQPYGSGNLVVFKQKPENITYTVSKSVISHYQNGEDESILSLEESNEIIEKINLSRVYNDDLEDYTYDTLDDEIYALRFYKTYTPIRKHINETVNISFEIIEYPVSEYSNIIPLYSLDLHNVFDTKCKYIPNNIEIFYEVCNDYGIDKSRIDVPSHSGLRYAKIDDKFITGMEDFEKSSSSTLIDTYEKCVDRLKLHKVKLENIVSLHLAKQSQKVLDKTTVGNLLIELLAIKNRVSSLDVKSKEYSIQRSLENHINDLINTYKQLV